MLRKEDLYFRGSYSSQVFIFLNSVAGIIERLPGFWSSNKEQAMKKTSWKISGRST